MKKLISTLAVTAIAVAAFATGSFQADAPQSGVLAFTAATGGRTTNYFAPAFSTIPVMQIVGSDSTAYPYTNTVTKTYFILGMSVTNVSASWNAYIGYPRIQYGTNAPNALVAYTNAFNPPYAFTPVVSVMASSMGSSNATPVLASVTSSNFIFSIGIDCTNQTYRWQAIGSAFQPGSQNVTY